MSDSRHWPTWSCNHLRWKKWSTRLFGAIPLSVSCSPLFRSPEMNCGLVFFQQCLHRTNIAHTAGMSAKYPSPGYPAQPSINLKPACLKYSGTWHGTLISHLSSAANRCLPFFLLLSFFTFYNLSLFFNFLSSLCFLLTSLSLLYMSGGMMIVVSAIYVCFSWYVY